MRRGSPPHNQAADDRVTPPDEFFNNYMKIQNTPNPSSAGSDESPLSGVAVGAILVATLI
jgi:hypothetical protein